MPPLLSTTRARHALPTAGFRFALAQRASGDGRPARAVLARGSSEIRGPLAIACAREAGALLSALSGWGSFVEQMRGETQEQASLAAAAPEGVP